MNSPSAVLEISHSLRRRNPAMLCQHGVNVQQTEPHSRPVESKKGPGVFSVDGSAQNALRHG